MDCTMARGNMLMLNIAVCAFMPSSGLTQRIYLQSFRVLLTGTILYLEPSINFYKRATLHISRPQTIHDSIVLSVQQHHSSL